MFKEKTLFVKNQINQIHEKGVHILYQKVKKLFSQLFMNIFAPLAVHFKIKWSKAYAFVGKKKIKKLKKLHAQSIVNEPAIREARSQAVEYFEEIVHEPASFDKQDWTEASRSLSGLYFHQGRMKEMKDVLEKDAEVQRKFTKEHHFDDLGIEFLPRYLAVGSIGNFEHLDIYIKAEKLGLRPKKKLILLVDPKATIVNPCYFNYWRKYITIISDPSLVEALTPLEKQLTVPLNLFMILREKVCRSFLALGAVREQWVNDKRPPILTLSDEDYDRGWETLESRGVQKKDWFVCIHVRERGWKDKNSSAEDFRNADINTYKSAIKAVTDAGGWVIRLGDSSMTPLGEMPHVIDYAHSDIKNDWMDVFLSSQCRFFIGTSSGPCTFAMAFGKPVVATNFLPSCGAYYLTSDDLFIPGLCKDKATNQFLNFSELYSPQMGTAAVQFIYDGRNLEVIKNTEEEIKDLVEEMLERYDESLSYSEEDEQLQKLFKAVTLDCGKLYGEENLGVNARVGRGFLRKHVALLPSKEKTGILNVPEGVK